MATYPYSSPPPPPSPCHNKTSPILLPPPPPPPPACNHTTTPPLPSPSPSPTPTPTPPCACNKNTTPPPPPPSPSPPPPHHHSEPVHHSPPTPSPPPPRSPPAVLPPPPSQPPPKPSRKQASPPPLLQPATPPPSTSPYYFPQPPVNPPLSPDQPPCHCVCPSPWAAPPNPHNSIPPNSYNQIAPGPQLVAPSNPQRTVIVTTFVSLGGVFFLAFIVIGLLSMAMKKKMPRMPSGTAQPGSHVQSQGDVHKFESIPTSTSTAQTVINVDDPAGLDPKPAENQKVQQGMSLPDPGAGEIVEQGSQETGNPNVPDKMSSDAEFSKPSSDTNMDAPQGAEEGKLEKSKSGLLDEKTDDADASPNVEEGSQEAGDDSKNDSRKKLRLPKKKKSPRSGAKKGNDKCSGLSQVANAAKILGAQEIPDDDDDDDEDQPSEEQPHDDDEENVRQPAGNEQEAERDAPQGAEDGKLDKSINRFLEETSAPGDADASSNVEERSQEAVDDDSRMKLRLPKKPNSPSKGAKKGIKKPSGLSQVVNAASILEAQEIPDDGDDEDQPGEEQRHDDDEENVEQPAGDEQEAERDIDQTEKNNKGLGQNVEERPVGEESTDSKQNLRLRNKKISSSRVAKNKDQSRSRDRQGVNVARNFGLDDAPQSQDGDNDEEQVSESEAQGNEEEVIAGTDENVEQPTGDEQEAKERDDKPLIDQPEEDNKGFGQNAEERSVGEKSTDSKQKLCLRNKKISASRVAKNEDKTRSRVRQGVNIAGTYGLDEADKTQDGDEDEEQVSESKALGEGEELIADTYENLEQPPEDKQEVEDSDDKPLTPRTDADNRDSGQNVEEMSVGEESIGSKQKLRLHNKKTSPSRVSKNGDKKFSQIRQGMNVARTFGLNEADETQDNDEDEEHEIASEAQGDKEEFTAGTSNDTDENVEQPAADEQDADECDDKPLIDQLEGNNSSQNVEDKSIGEESNDRKQKLRLRNVKKSQGRVAKKEDEKRSRVREGVNIARTFGLDEAQQSQEVDDDEEQVRESEVQVNEGEFIAGADENVEPVVDEQDAEECDNKPQTQQTETDYKDSCQNVEKRLVGEGSNNSKQRSRLPSKKKPLSRVAKKGDQKPSRVRQGVHVARTVGLDEAQQYQDVDDDEEEVRESEAREDEEELIAGTSDNPELDAQDNDEALLLGGPTNTDGNDEVEAEESELLQDTEELNSWFNDSSNIMGPLDDVEGKLKVSGPFSSAQQSKQALKKAMVY